MRQIISKSFLIFAASLFFISLLCINKNCCAQAGNGWIVPPPNPPQTGNIKGAIYVLDGTIYMVKDSCRIEKSTDLGRTWTIHLEGCSQVLFCIRVAVYSIPQVSDPVASDTVWACGGAGTIYYTNNGGATWIQQVSGTSYDLTGLSFANNQVGWAVGGTNTACVILHTTNAGTNWSPQSTTLTYGLLSVSFVDLNHGWACASHNTIIYTSNGGTNWIDRSPALPSTSIWFSTYFINPDTGWAVGNNGTGQALSIRTTNGGVSWYLGNVNSGNPNTLAGVCFINSNTGFAAGGSFSNTGTVLKTTDGGNNWVSQTLPAGTHFLNSVSFLNPDTGVVCGNNGQILYTFSSGEPIGIIPISSEIPKNFSLSQNYPNPFNPSTNISIAISKSGFVKLIVYDAAGREIETLVNQQLQPGTYEVSWDADNYPSGVYFYKLVTGSITQTRKMVLLK